MSSKYLRLVAQFCKVKRKRQAVERCPNGAPKPPRDDKPVAPTGDQVRWMDSQMGPV